MGDAALMASHYRVHAANVDDGLDRYAAKVRIRHSPLLRKAVHARRRRAKQILSAQPRGDAGM
jgi:hypothetical protein